MTDDSTCVGHEPCPECGSKDNLARYSDGHGYCFGCGFYEKGTADGVYAIRESRTKEKRVKELISGEVKALAKRGISEETCRHWGYKVGTFSDKTVQIATYCDDDGQPVAQKLRFANKDFTVLGDLKKAGLFGQHLWRDGGKKVVVTEGEIDALSVSQLQQNKWPVVSVPNGAQGAAKAIAKSIEWLCRFDQVVLLLDDDEPGRKAAQECAALLPPGKAYIGRIAGYKDANEALQAGDGAKVIDAIWGAKAYRPDGIVEIDDEFLEELDKPVEWGLPWCFETLNKLTYGRRWGEVYTFGAGTGIGKTDVLTQQAEYDINTLGLRVGLIYLEQKPKETAVRIAGKASGKRFHVPDSGWQPEERKAALAALKGKVSMYDSFGETDWDVVKSKVRFMSANGIRVFYLDHLTAMADPSNEKESLETLMKELATLAMELQIIVHLVSHLSTPEGKPHEEGGRVMIRHFKGSRAIGFWSHFMFGLERDQQAASEAARSVTTFRVLKDRYTGQATGHVFGLGYDAVTGRLFEAALPDEGGFADETGGADGDCPF